MFLSSSTRLYIGIGLSALTSLSVMTYIYTDIYQINTKMLVKEYETKLNTLETENEKLRTKIKLYEENPNVVKYNTV